MGEEQHDRQLFEEKGIVERPHRPRIGGGGSSPKAHGHEENSEVGAKARALQRTSKDTDIFDERLESVFELCKLDTEGLHETWRTSL